MCLNCQLYSEVNSSFTLVKSAKKVKRYNVGVLALPGMIQKKVP